MVFRCVDISLCCFIVVKGPTQHERALVVKEYVLLCHTIFNCCVWILNDYGLWTLNVKMISDIPCAKTHVFTCRAYQDLWGQKGSREKRAKWYTLDPLFFSNYVEDIYIFISQCFLYFKSIKNTWISSYDLIQGDPGFRGPIGMKGEPGDSVSDWTRVSLISFLFTTIKLHWLIF